jgi:putative membrane-bound dehydrogenase-like protein
MNPLEHPGWHRLCPTLPLAAAVLGAAIAGGAVAADPQVLLPGAVLERFAAEPDIVTPVGAAFDARGRLVVIESHTHFRPKGYAGPPHDRLRIVEDTDGDGRADRFRTFLDGLAFAMGLRRGPDDWLYVVTRNGIERVRDADGDDVAEVREPLVQLETAGQYPHNGLGGLAFDAAGRLWFGLGENLGADYRLVAADRSECTGGGEGGSVFRCTGAGTRLERVATGFWNPFGLCCDPAGRTFAVDNDPDSRPPCRLIDVVTTGDYGYQFRFGRGGRHPLQAWDGDIPGTLPMAAGTGEAPCAIVPFAGALWVTSWGGNRVERFTLEPRGATVKAVGTIAIQGNHRFRPVDAAVAPDGSLFITDWVDRSYPVHGAGSIWRLRLPPHENPPRRSTRCRSRSRVRACCSPATGSRTKATLRRPRPPKRSPAGPSTTPTTGCEFPRSVGSQAPGWSRCDPKSTESWPTRPPP